MPVEPAPDRRPASGYFAVPARLALTGLERHRQPTRWRAEPPAIQHLTGPRAMEISLRIATFAMPASGWLVGPVGVLSGGDPLDRTLAVIEPGPAPVLRSLAGRDAVPTPPDAAS